MKIPKKVKAILMAVVMLLSMGLNGLVASAAGTPTKTEGSITIYKFEEPDLGTSSNGIEIEDLDNLDLTPIEGIKFQITRMVLVDDQSNPGSDAIQANNNLYYRPATNTDVGGAYSAETAPTGFDGKTTKTGLPLGVYYVEELGNTTTFGRESFFVSIPIEDPAGNNGVNGDGYLYDIYVYPKNETIQIDKEVVGDKTYNNIVEWKITTNIPNDIAEGKIFKIIDELDHALTLDQSSIEVFVDGKDITTWFDSNASSEHRLELSLLPAYFSGASSENGLDFYLNSNITVTFRTMIAEGTLGEIDNDAEVSYTNKTGEIFDKNTDDLDPDPDPHVPSFGIDILKYGDSDTGNLLSGAGFYLFPTREAAENAITNNNYNGALTYDGTNPWTGSTNGDGVLQFKGLTEGTYYLVEKTAPNGYNLLTGPVKIDITYDDTSKEVTYSINDGQSVTVSGLGDEDNNKDPQAVKPLYLIPVEINNSSGFELPLTGGTGTMLFTLIGLLLIGAAIVIYTISKKRKEQQA